MNLPRAALLGLLLLGAGACGKKEQVVIFATGRTQGRLWEDKAAGVGGFAAFKNLYAAEKSPKLALDLGNWTSPSPESWFSKGRASLDCLNALPYAAAAPGYEDLALPPADMQKLAQASGMPLLASNLYLKTNKKPDYLRSWHIARAGSRKVGVFSLVINSPANFNAQKHLPGYKLEKATYEAERAIRSLRENGAGLVVMLLAVNPKEKAGHEFFGSLLAGLPRVDLVITDEPTIKKPFKIKKAWVAPAGHGLARVSRLALQLDPATGKLGGLKFSSLKPAPGEHGEDPEMLKVLDGHRKAAAAHFGRRVGFLNAALPLQDHGVYPAADFAADCMRRWARGNAAIIGLKEPAAGFSSGPVTTGDLYRSFPLDSSVVFVKIRGDDLERALAGLQPGEISVSGLRLFLNGGVLEKAEAEGGPLVPGKVYHVAVPDSLVAGRDNPVLSSAMEFANSRRQLREVIGWCFSRQKSFSRPAGGRVIKTEAQ